MCTRKRGRGGEGGGRASDRERQKDSRSLCLCLWLCMVFFSNCQHCSASFVARARTRTTRARARTPHSATHTTYQRDSTRLVPWLQATQTAKRRAQQDGFLTEIPPQSFTGKLKSSGLYPTNADQGEANSPWLMTLHRGFGSMVVENLGFTSSEPGQSNGSAASSNGVGKKVSISVCARARERLTHTNTPRVIKSCSF